MSQCAVADYNPNKYDFSLRLNCPKLMSCRSSGGRSFQTLGPVVQHKRSFSCQCRDEQTGQDVTIHTNQIQGTWKHDKDHFKHMNGTKVTQFEGHLWKSCGDGGTADQSRRPFWSW